MLKRLATMLVLAGLPVGLLWSGATAGFSSRLSAEIHTQSSVAWDSLTTPELIEAAQASGRIDQDTALLYLAYALGDYARLPGKYRSDIPWHGTMPLLRLQESVSVVQSAVMRSAIRSVLRGTCSSSSSFLPLTRNTTNFHVEYDTIGGGLTIDDYATSLETAWGAQVTTFGWAAPPVLSSNPPPGNRYHVRIDALGGGLYGYVSNGGDHAGFVGDNPNTAWNDGDAYASCMVLNRDYSPFPGTSQQALDATTAHEFNHSIQFGYGAITGANRPDDAFVEGGATWMEDEVFDSSNDNHNYLWPTFTASMGEYPYSPYPYWITFRGLTERYGTGTAGGGEDVMQDFWEETSKSSSSNMLTAMNTALANKGTTLADAYHAYAIAVKFNKACGGGYVYPHCLEEGPAYVSAAGATSVQGTIVAVGNGYSGSVRDNYALNWVSLPTSGGPYDVTLENTSGGGQLRGSVACDTGAAIAVSALPTVVGPGSSSTLGSFNPTGCTSVVAVVSNQSQTADNPTFSTSRSYVLSTSVSTATSTPTDTPTATASPTPTYTPSATPTPTITSTPTTTPTPTKQATGDTDLDGCSDVEENGPNEELGGQRNYRYFWDLYDVWSHPVGDPSGWERDQTITMFGDILGVAFRFGATDDNDPPPTGDGIPDKPINRNSDPLVPPTDETSYHPAFDRGAQVGPNLWDLGPPDGTIDLFIDIFGVANQFGHDCTAAP